MLTSAPTKQGAGITLYGDYFDLEALHATTHKIATEGFMEERAREFLLSLAYDIRTAKERKREERKFGMADSKVKYCGVRILWPHFLPQLAMLRHYAGYRNTDHRDQACLYLLEDCAITSLLAFDAKVGSEAAKLLLNFPPFSNDYIFEFCTDRARKYVFASTGQKRFKNLPQTLRAMYWFSPEYKAFSVEMETAAKEKNCTPHDLHQVAEWPNFRW